MLIILNAFALALDAEKLKDKKIINDINEFLKLAQPALGRRICSIYPMGKAKLEKRKYYDVFLISRNGLIPFKLASLVKPDIIQMTQY